MTARKTILDMLADGSRQKGLDMVRASLGTLKRGVIYVHLIGLEDDGYIRSFDCDDDRKQYEITSAGRAARLRDAP